MNLRMLVYQIILLNLLMEPCSGQVLSLGFGQMFYNSKTIVPVVNQFESNNNDQYYSLDLSVIEIDRWLFGTELGAYSGWVDFNASAETWVGFGASQTTLFRLSPYVAYIINPNHKLRFIPYFKVIIEQSIITGLHSGINVVAEVDEPFGYQGIISVEPIQRLQLAPGVGLTLSWNPVGRIYLLGNIYYASGYLPFQKYYFEYSYQGVKQPTAEWHANGTGVFTSLSLGYKIWNTNKDSKSRK